MLEKTQAPHFNLGGQSTAQDGSNGMASLPATKEGPTLTEASRELAAIKNSLGFIDNFVVDRKINRDAKRVLAEGYLQLIEAKRQELIAKITIGLAESKKMLLVESLRMSGAIDREIADLSSEFAAAMFNGAVAANFAAAEQEFKKLDEIETAYKAGRMTEARYQQLRGTVSEAADHVISIVKDNVSQIIQSHIGQIKLALELFRERTLGKGF